MDKKNSINNFLGFDTIKINYSNNSFWFVPHFLQGIFSTSRSKWAIRPFKNLKELIDQNNLIFQECNFSFNRDDNFKFFNELMKIREINFMLIQSDKKSNVIKSFKIKNTEIIFDKKSIKFILKGISPFYSKFYYDKINQKPNELKKIVWRNRKFDKYE